MQCNSVMGDYSGALICFVIRHCNENYYCSGVIASNIQPRIAICFKTDCASCIHIILQAGMANSVVDTKCQVKSGGVIGPTDSQRVVIPC
jgi:hypothetical protein